MDDEVQNDSKQNADYEAAYYGKENLKVPLLHEYITETTQ
jgi:hypothetical protein